MNKKITLNPKATLLQPGKGSTYLALGDLYTFLAVGEDTGGAYALYEMVMQPQSITPPHSHDQADESHYILDRHWGCRRNCEATHTSSCLN
jgi:quercetin dioxygenase-like cupin family protein